jgi:transcriptional regulator with XRE-family HTH domain
MAKLGTHANSQLATFLRARLAELAASGMTQTEIAARAGYPNQNMITMLKQGTTKLALDRVAGLARGLDVDPRHLFVMALEQQGHETTAQEIREIFGVVVTRNEAEWIETLRKASAHTDPPITRRGRVALATLFGKSE